MYGKKEVDFFRCDYFNGDCTCGCGVDDHGIVPQLDEIQRRIGFLNKEYQYTLKDLAETNSNLGDNGFKMFGAMNAFAYITMILALVSFASVALAKFLNMKLIKPVAALAGLLTILSTILLIVFVCMFCSKNAGFSFSIAGVNLADGKFGWSVGPILMVIGGFLSGLPALAAYKK